MFKYHTIPIIQSDTEFGLSPTKNQAKFKNYYDDLKRNNYFLKDVIKGKKSLDYNHEIGDKVLVFN